jgi:hypothetical protein
MRFSPLVLVHGRIFSSINKTIMNQSQALPMQNHKNFVAKGTSPFPCPLAMTTLFTAPASSGESVGRVFGILLSKYRQKNGVWCAKLRLSSNCCPNNYPTGFYKSGSYCTRMSSSDREAPPREDGSKCPTGWYKSGGYCVK